MKPSDKEKLEMAISILEIISKFELDVNVQGIYHAAEDMRKLARVAVRQLKK